MNLRPLDPEPSALAKLSYTPVILVDRPGRNYIAFSRFCKGRGVMATLLGWLGQLHLGFGNVRRLQIGCAI